MQIPVVLLIDDDPDAAEIVRHRLSAAGFQGALKTLTSGRSALAFLTPILAGKAPSPELVLLDLMLPDQHGFEVLREIRKSPIGARLFVAVLSASSHPADRDGGYSSGANRYVEKYPSSDELRRLLEHARETDASDSDLARS